MAGRDLRGRNGLDWTGSDWIELRMRVQDD